MDRLINADALKKWLIDNYTLCDNEKLLYDIDRQPAVDPIRHGHWITEEEAEERDEIWLRGACSVCKHCDWDCTESEDFNYCPNCGAKMGLK